MAKKDDNLLLYILLGGAAYLYFFRQPAQATAASTGSAVSYRPTTTNRAPTTTQAYASSTYVKWVQDSLNQLIGAGLSVDGIIGPMTKSAIVKFQSTWGITPDGVVGPETDYYINAALGMPGYTEKPYAPIPSGELIY